MVVINSRNSRSSTRISASNSATFIDRPPCIFAGDGQDEKRKNYEKTIKIQVFLMRNLKKMRSCGILTTQQFMLCYNVSVH